MGYYTRFALKEPTYRDGKPLSDDLLEQICNEVPSGYSFTIGELLDDALDDMKWYECLEDMARLSVKYQNVLFTLSGRGEESGDIWAAYFMNGESCIKRAEIVLQPLGDDELRNFVPYG